MSYPPKKGWGGEEGKVRLEICNDEHHEHHILAHSTSLPPIPPHSSLFLPRKEKEKEKAKIRRE